MMEKKRKLDSLSSKLFFSGLTIGKLSKTKLPIIASASFILSALLYFAGYCVWQSSVNEVNSIKKSIATELKEKFEHEYRHIPQYSYAAILGIFASIAMLSSIFAPISLGLASSWLFLSSNLFWWWAENINTNRLRADKPNSEELITQEYYYAYTNFATLSSLLSTCCLSLCLVLPSLTLPIGAILTTNLAAINIFALTNWIQSTYRTNHYIEPDIIDSYQKISHNTPTIKQSPQPQKPSHHLQNAPKPSTEWHLKRPLPPLTYHSSEGASPRLSL